MTLKEKQMKKLLLLSAISLIAVGNAYAAKEFLNVSYDPTREFYQEYNKSFGQFWKSKTGARH